jgi:hypothetical protein
MTLLLFFSACLFNQPQPTVEIIYTEIEINGETPYNRR